MTDVLIPWRSKKKASVYLKNKNISRGIAKSRLRDITPDSWDWKKQRKYMLPTYGPRNTWVIDLFFPGKFMYLIGININTRYGIALKPSNIRKMPNGGWRIPRTNLKTTKTLLNMLNKFINNTRGALKFDYLISDQESAFKSREFKKFCRDNNIEHIVYEKNKFGGLIDTNADSRGNHSMLGMVDRFIRTIRQMAYNLGVKNQNIDPDTMYDILQEYNHSPHTTFYRILGKDITPSEMAQNPKLEDKFVSILAKKKFLIKNKPGYNLEKKRVRVYNEAHVFDKVRPKLLPGVFDVVGRDGYLYIVKRGQYTLKLPRYLLKAV